MFARSGDTGSAGKNQDPSFRSEWQRGVLDRAYLRGLVPFW
jgi:hypothetical protein